MCKGMLVQGDDRGINFANGFVGEDLFVTDHDPKYGATFTLPFEYNRDAASQCPKWLAFLHSCWGSEPDFDDRFMPLQDDRQSVGEGMSVSGGVNLGGCGSV